MDDEPAPPGHATWAWCTSFVLLMRCQRIETAQGQIILTVIEQQQQWKGSHNRFRGNGSDREYNKGHCLFTTASFQVRWQSDFWLLFKTRILRRTTCNTKIVECQKLFTLLRPRSWRNGINWKLRKKLYDLKRARIHIFGRTWGKQRNRSIVIRPIHAPPHYMTLWKRNISRLV